MPKFPIIDFHTHTKREADAVVEVISIDPCRPPKHCLWYTIGHHPWWTTDALAPDALVHLRQTLADDPRCLALGECGLDKLKGIDLDAQERVFIQQIEVANQVGAPLVVHCVRVYDRLLRLHRLYARTPWAVHGFPRNATLAASLLRAGLYLSVAPADRLTPVFEQTLLSIPLDRLFLETDSDPSLAIADCYQRFARLRCLSPDALAERLVRNFQTFFAWKTPPL